MNKLIDLSEVRKKIAKKKFIMNTFFIIIIIYIIYTVYLIVKIPTDTITIENGSLTAEESATGYIIRDEVVVKGKNYKNGLYQIVIEGERAAKKQTIFRYYGKNEKEFEEKIKAVNSKIENALKKENIIFSTDIKNLDEQIESKIQNLQNTNDVQRLTEYKKQISEMMLKKAEIAGENSKSGSYIKKLIKERESLEEKLSKGSEYITAPKSGVVSYRVDGLEEVLKASNFENLSEEKLEKLDVKTGKIVGTNNEQGKIINNFECYIATLLDSKEAIQAETGKNVQISLSNNTEITANIEYVKKQPSGKMLVVFKINTLTEELISFRKISFNITWWNINGIKIPNTAIYEDENGLKYVNKKTATGITKCLVKVLKTNEQYSIIGSYTDDDLKNLKIEKNDYKEINMYDTITIYQK